MANAQVNAVTGDSGRFWVGNLDPGTSLLEFRRIGYEPYSMQVWVEPAVLSVRVLLEPAPLRLDDIEVEGEAVTLARPHLRRFEQRRSMGIGHFLARDDIEEINPSQVTDLLMHTPGLRVYPNPGYGVSGDRRRYIIQSSRRVARLMGVCEVSFFLDGMFVGTSGGDDLPIEQLISIPALEAVEVYSGPSQTPAEYNRGGGTCGVVAFWTR